MRKQLGVLVAIAGALVLAGCASTPSSVLRAYDSCDRQTALCYDSCLSAQSREEGASCDRACDADADRCFWTITQQGLERNPDWDMGQDFVFYGRTGAWSAQFGWQPGPHGEPYTYTRPEDRNTYNRRYYDPYYDSPYDCYGWRRASRCWNRDWYRDRDRRKYNPRPGNPRPDPQPDDPKPRPDKPVIDDPRPDPGDSPVRRRPVREPQRVTPDQPAPTDPDNRRRNDQFEPLIPPSQSSPQPKPQPQPRQTQPPQRSTPSPVRRSEPVARPQPQPQRTTPQPQPKPSSTRPASRPAPKPRPAPEPRQSGNQDSDQID